MKQAFVLIFILLAATRTKAQDQHYMDSLSAYLKGPDDTLKLNAISDLAWEYNKSDVNKAISLSYLGLKIAIKLKSGANVAQANEDLGTSYYYKRDFDSSAYFYTVAEKTIRKQNDTNALALLLNKIGALYRERSDYTTALKYNLESLQLFQQLHNEKKTALLLNNVGSTYEVLKKYDIALDYYTRALQLNTTIKNEKGLGRNYLGIGNIYTTLKRFNEAIDYYQRAAIIFKKVGWLVETAITLNNLGNVYDLQHLYKESIEKRKEALEIAREMEDPFEEAKYHAYIAGTLMKAGNFNEAKTHIEATEKLSQSLQSVEIRMEVYEAWAKYYFGSNNFTKGNEYLVEFHFLKDSIYSAGLSTNIAAMEVKHNTQQLRLENAEAETQNLKLSNETLRATEQRNYILISTICLVIVSSVLFSFYNQRRKQKEEKERINAMLVSEEKERIRIARELHDGLGQVLSTARLNAAALEGSVDQEDEAILNNTLKLIDQSISEVRSISHNMMPQVLSDKGLLEALFELIDRINAAKAVVVNFDHSVFNSNLEKSIEISVYRVIQEILNNMIKHSAASTITLTLANDGANLKILVSDNGKGFDTTLIEKSEGLGWKNILTRLSLINGKFGVDSKPGKGTTLNIEVAL